MIDDALSLEWLGCTTYRIRIGGLTLLLDTFVDRPASAPQVGVSAADLSADFAFISHAHIDHILGADVVAKNGGATIVGSYESIRLMREAGVPEAQVLPVSGGETVDCGHDVRVRVYPSLHSCLFTPRRWDSGAECLGDLGVSHQERLARVLNSELFGSPDTPPEILVYYRGLTSPYSSFDGGQLMYLVETPRGSILWSASAGCWSPILRGLRPDVAVLAAAGRPNLDGEPFQGTLAEFLVREIEMLRPGRTIFCHHDAFLAPMTPATDTTAAAEAVRNRCPYTELVDLTYLNPVPILD
ncbi:MBL fold metallo-hydrolase [Amycolatopsis anabasis]|uniref:MBL fold metallo-hydrolase n=1 Tax=Amycolatopsis anabasis TaxID=1840409 RepID=UPI00131DF252|nr:MBL fold metallo-hydrolase [Amycolatopsis anabasis]